MVLAGVDLVVLARVDLMILARVDLMILSGVDLVVQTSGPGGGSVSPSPVDSGPGGASVVGVSVLGTLLISSKIF